jgi:GT2 family glycosyltransferase
VLRRQLTLARGAIRKAWTAFRERRLPLSPRWWLRALALHWHEGLGRQPASLQPGGQDDSQAQLDVSYARWLLTRKPPAAIAFDEALTIVAFVSDPRHAIDVVTSVRAQSISAWTLWFVAAPPRDSPNQLTAWPSWPDDRRIKLIEHEDIVRPDGTWLPPGDGDYVVLLDSHCLLAPDALVHIIPAIRAARPDWLYTDDDRISDAGVRSDPNLKGAFSPELALADDYATRLAVVSRQAIDRCGGLRRDCGDAQIYDLLLRIVENGGAVTHLTEVCCHRRFAVPAVLTESHRQAARRSITARCKGAEVVTGPGVGTTFETQRVRWPGAPQRTTIVVPTHDRADLLASCITALSRTVDPSIATLLVIDDDSREDSARALLESLERERPFGCRVIRHARRSEEFNYARLMNEAARMVDTPLMLHLNNDVQGLAPGWLEQMSGWTSYSEIGVVGAKLLYPDGLLQHAGVIVLPDQIPEHLFHRSGPAQAGYQWLPHRLRNVSAVTGACLLTRTDLYLRVGGFDEVHLPVQFNDIDYCLEVIARGYRVVYEPAATLQHVTSASRGRQYDLRENDYFLLKHRGYRDPFISAHLDPASLFGTRPQLQ